MFIYIGVQNISEYRLQSEIVNGQSVTVSQSHMCLQMSRQNATWSLYDCSEPGTHGTVYLCEHSTYMQFSHIHT